jgi:putative transposase
MLKDRTAGLFENNTDRRSDPRQFLPSTHMLGNLFDPKAEFFKHERMRPHWSQAGAIVFITARTADSIPRDVLLRWEREKREWFEALEKRLGKSILGQRDWRMALQDLDDENRQAFVKHFNRQRETEMDRCHGKCWLRYPEYARIVADSLMHFDCERYRMGDFVIMPNHFHALVAFGNPDAMEKQIASWLHWTATQLNRKTGIRGHFWQQEPFDHLVRSLEQYDYLRRYIADNPKKARLSVGEYIYRRLED